MLKTHYGVTVDSEKPTTGVFQNNHVDYLGDELTDNWGISNADSLDFEQARNDFLQEKITEIQRILDDIDGDNYEASASNIRDVCELLEEADSNLDVETTEWLLGFVKTFDKSGAWYWYPYLKCGFKPDPEAEYSAIVGEIYLQVVRRQWVLRAALCSPCYPGQGDVNTEGDFLSYSLPPDLFLDVNPIRKRIVRAE